MAVDPLVNEPRDAKVVALRRALASAQAEVQRLQQQNDAQAAIIRSLAALVGREGASPPRPTHR
jgi:hypothetical protein